MRIERDDGTIVEGILEPRRQTPDTLSLFLHETQSYIDIPHSDVRRVWLPHVVRRRHLGYMASATVIALVVGVMSVRLTGSEATPGILLAAAVWLTFMLAQWLPFIHNRIVIWQLRFSTSE